MTDLDELERLLRHSTPTPWDAEGNSVRSLQPWSASGLVATTSMAPDMQDAEDNAALIAALRNHAEELIRDARRWRDLDLSGIVHDAVLRALDEAGVRNEVLRGMCLEVAIEKAQDAIAPEGKG